MRTWPERAPNVARALPGVALIAEALILSFAFDLRTVIESTRWWSSLGYWGEYLPLIAVVGVSLLLAGGRNLQAALAAQKPARNAGWWLLGVVPFASAFATSAALTQAGAAHGRFVLPFVWVLAVVAWGLVRLHGLLPLSAWWRLVRADPGSYGLAIVIGCLAFLAGRGGLQGWPALAPLTLAVAGGLLVLSGHQPWATEGQVLGLDDFSVRVAPVCSGIEGMGLMAAFLVGFIFFFRKELRVGRALSLVPVAVAFTYFANAARIALLMVIGASGAEGVALSGFHSKAGWVFFSLIAVAAMMALRRWSFTATAPSAGAETALEAAPGQTAPLRSNEDPAASTLRAYLLPLVVLTAVALVTETFQSRIDRYYVLRVLAACTVLWLYRKRLASLGRPQARDWMLGLAGGCLMLGIWLGLVPRDLASAQELRRAWFALPEGVRWLEWLWRGVGAIVMVPLVEELAFRGYLLRRLTGPDFSSVRYREVSMVALLVSSAAFGLLHGSAWLPAMACGLAYGWLARLRNNLWAPLFAHAATNAGLAAYVLMTGSYDLW